MCVLFEFIYCYFSYFSSTSVFFLMSFIKYLCKKVASVDEKLFSFLASCQIMQNLNFSAIDFCNVFDMTALFDE